MADPLSIAASIAGVVTLADLVFGRLYKYTKAVKDAPSDVKELASQVNSLGGLLNSLARLARALDGEPFDVTLRMEHVDACNFILSKLDKKLQKAEKDLARHGHFDRFERRLKWPFSTSEVKEIKTELSGHETKIGLALSADTMSGLLLSLSYQSEVRDTTAEILSHAQETRKITTRIERTSERTKILDFFLKHNPQENYDMSLGLRHPRTGLWLLRLPAFQNWLNSPCSKLWLSGIPGAGKTVLAASVIEEALRKSSGKVAVAFYFCDYKTEMTLKPNNILGAILAQLALQSEDAFEELENFYRRLHPSNGLARSPRSTEIAMVLSKVTETFEKVFVVVDGLDECGQHTTAVVEDLASYADDHGNLCIALLSRDEDEIRFRLGEEFDNLEIAAHSEDVAEYVSSEIQERQRTGRLRVRNTELLADIQQQLVDKAHGMFRWVTCQLDHLGDCHNDRACREALDKLPPDLEETYVRLLQRIRPSQETLVQMTLNFVGYIGNGISIPELLQAVSISPEQKSLSSRDVIYEESISRACSSLIRKTNDGRNFQFAHFSVREFLESARLLGIGLDQFQISRPRCSRMFAVQCLRFLHLENFNVKTNLQGGSVEKVESGLVDILKSRHDEYPFYAFAATSWLRHARSQWSDEELWQLSRRLFDPRKSNYFTQWALDMLRFLGVGDVSTAPGTLIGILRPSFTPLHLSAILGIPEICQYLISSGIDVYSECHLGSAIDCAVSSIGALWPDMDIHSEDAVSTLEKNLEKVIADQEHLQHDVTRTVDCVLGAQTSVLLSRIVASKPALMETALRTCNSIKDFSMIAILIQNEIEPEEKDHDVFEEAIGKLCSSIQGSYLAYLDLRGQDFFRTTEERRLEAFIRSLNNMIGKYLGDYAFCSIAWNKALSHDVSFTSDISIVNSQISLDLESLKELGMSGAVTWDMAKLDTFMGDPRVSADGLACSTKDGGGNTLLHLALAPTYAKYAGFSNGLAVAQRLLEAGCMPSAINKYGDTPLHDWTWAEDAIEAQKSEVESLMQSFLEKGASIHTKGMSGHTALHRFALEGQTGTLRTMLHVISDEETLVALATTDDDGFTPLMRALERNHAETSEVLIRNGKNEFGSLDISKLLSLVGGIESVSLLRLLLAIGFPINSDNGESALHHVKWTTPLDCIRVLKENLPDSCSERFGGRYPIEIYLREWSSVSDEDIIDKEEDGVSLEPSFEILEEFAAIERQESRDGDGLTVWAYATARIIKNLRVHQIPNLPTYRAQRKKLFTKGVQHLMKLGYMTSHETTTGESGLITLLPCLASYNVGWSGLWPAEPGLLTEISTETTHWSDFRKSAIALDFLCASFEVGHPPLLRILLERGIPLVRNGFILRTAQRMCEALYETKPECFKTCARVVLEHCPDEVLGATNSAQKELALIHRVQSPWLAEELLFRGADPNLREPSEHFSSPALVQHLLTGSPAVALHLLKRGADPELANARGINAMHAALAFGHLSVLQAIHGVISLPGHASWYATCTFIHDNVTWRAISGLELGALSGQTSCIKFLLDNGDAQKLKNTPNEWDLITLAARGGHGDVIRYLHKLEFDINIARPPDRLTPLHVAVMHGRLPAVEALVQLGALHMEDRQGLTPLELAHTSNHPKIAELLDQAFPDSSRQAGNQSQLVRQSRKLSAAFEKAITTGNIDACKYLHKLGHPLDSELSCGCPYLTKAFKLSSDDIAGWLVSEEASLTRHSCMKHGNSSTFRVWLCQYQPDESLIDLLLEKYIQQGGDVVQKHLLECAATSLYSGRLRALLRAMEASIGNQKNQGCPPTASDVVSQLGGISVLSDAHEAASEANFTANANLLADYIAVALPYDEPCPPSAIIPLFTGDWKARMNNAKFYSPSIWESRDYEGWKPMLIACESLPLDVTIFLKNRGADCTKTNLWYSSALHIAADKTRPDVFSMLVRSGVSPHGLNDEAVSPVHLAMAYGGLTTFILNQELALNDTQPMPWVPMGTDSGCFLRRDFNRYLRKLGKHHLRRITNLYPKDSWSPLCRFALAEDIEVMGNLIELGAEIDHDGSPDGSALMVASASGFMTSVKFLVRRNASLCYQTSDGQCRSALTAAKASASITNWLLVDRFTEQPKIGPPGPAEGTEEATRCWSGGAKAEYLIMGHNERRPDESSLEYYIRLMEVKEDMRGEVVPPAGKGKTTRPSRLMPIESVRRHPEDKRAPLK